MRADRLISLVLLLRRHPRLSASALAAELEVSTRTVLRDIEALSAAGVPVYAERGRNGGFSLLPGFRTELTGLNQEEALALVTSGSVDVRALFGLGPALASAMRKVLDALPEGDQASVGDAAARFLIDPSTDLLGRHSPAEHIGEGIMAEVRGAVVAGHKVRLRYQARDAAPRWRTVDPVGLVTVRGRGYLVARVRGADRTYRLSRILQAQHLPEAADRPQVAELDRVWEERAAQFLSEGHLEVVVRVESARREQLLELAEAVTAESIESDGWLRFEVTFQDLWHARWAVWQLGTGGEALEPPELRAALRESAALLAQRYASDAQESGGLRS